MNKWKLWLFPIPFILMIGLWCSGSINGEQSNVDNASPGQSVLVAAVQEVQKEQQLDMNGTVNPYEKAIATARVAGVLEEILVENGAAVYAGQPLAVIDSEPYRNGLQMAQAALQKAEAGLNNSEADYLRLQQLYEGGAISDKDLQDMELALQAVRADYQTALTAVANAERDLRHTTVTAPIDGVVVNRNVNKGQMLSAGYPLMEVENISSIYVDVKVRQQDLPCIEVGMKAEVSVDAVNEAVLTGAVAVINPSADPAARVFAIRVKADNPEHKVKAGMFATVKIHTGKTGPVLLIPQQALTSKQDRYYVFVPQDNERAKLQQVEIGDITGQTVEITKGLQAGQQVVVTNVNKLKDNDLIVISGGQED